MHSPFYIISDNHFMMKNTSSEKDRREKLFKVFSLIKKEGKGTLIIGGDFFDFWFETKNIVPKGYENLIVALQELNDAGIEIHFIAGNHDYWDFGYLQRTANINFHKGDLKFMLNGKNILITHGDGLLKNDYGYRFMKKIIRHQIFISIFKLIPPQISFKIANSISRSSSHYNHNDKIIDIIISDITEYAEKKWSNNIDIVMVGHYHQQKIIQKDNHSLIFLGDWLNKFSITILNDNKIWQGDWEEFIKLA
jgi:UDP-2,3-diacylglucosamine hydrolase